MLKGIARTLKALETAIDPEIDEDLHAIDRRSLAALLGVAPVNRTPPKTRALPGR